MDLAIKNKIMNLTDSKILLDESLKRHTTFGVGGPASIFIYPHNIEDLIRLLKFISKELLIAAPDCGLGHLSRDLAIKKLKIMSLAAKKFK